MKISSLIARVACILCMALPFARGQIDTTYVTEGMRVYEMLPLSVTAQRAALGATEATMTREFVNNALEEAGIAFIRRGVFLTTDVYFDGFRRGDIEIVIDGERTPNSCPARMDPPLSRVNPLEMDQVKVNRSSVGLHAGIGGSVEFHRSRPSDERRLRGGVTTTAGAARSVDAGFSVEARNLRLTGRYLRGVPFTDGSGRSFADRYDYRRDAPYGLYETSVQYGRGEIAAGVSYSYTEDVPFPYLHMDERFNKLVSGFISYGSTKLYANRTHHLMDTGLRNSYDMMQMETDVTNVTAGLTNDRFEIYYRRWDGWNRRQKPDGSMYVEQHMIPKSSSVSASVHHSISAGNTSLSGRIGFQLQGSDDDDRLGLHRTLYPDADARRWYVPFAAVAQYSELLTENISAGIEAEIGSRAPLLEEMFVALRRAGGKPAWVGNPTLKAPLRLSLRSALSGSSWRAELFGAHIFRYPALSRVDHQTTGFVTYSGVRALMTGVNVQYANRFASAAGSYTLGHNLNENHPLPEILPLTGNVRLLLPKRHGLSGFLGLTAATAQNRVAELLNEERTPGWYRLDAGLSYQSGALVLSMNVDNLLDRTYAQHLSYVRDPYSAGQKIYEPGRLVRISLQVDVD